MCGGLTPPALAHVKAGAFGNGERSGAGVDVEDVGTRAWHAAEGVAIDNDHDFLASNNVQVELGLGCDARAAFVVASERQVRRAGAGVEHGVEGATNGGDPEATRAGRGPIVGRIWAGRAGGAGCGVVVGAANGGTRGDAVTNRRAEVTCAGASDEADADALGRDDALGVGAVGVAVGVVIKGVVADLSRDRCEGSGQLELAAVGRKVVIDNDKHLLCAARGVGVGRILNTAGVAAIFARSGEVSAVGGEVQDGVECGVEGDVKAGAVGDIDHIHKVFAGLGLTAEAIVVGSIGRGVASDDAFGKRDGIGAGVAVDHEAVGRAAVAVGVVAVVADFARVEEAVAAAGGCEVDYERGGTGGGGAFAVSDKEQHGVGGAAGVVEGDHLGVGCEGTDGLARGEDCGAIRGEDEGAVVSAGGVEGGVEAFASGDGDGEDLVSAIAGAGEAAAFGGVVARVVVGEAEGGVDGVGAFGEGRGGVALVAVGLFDANAASGGAEVAGLDCRAVCGAAVARVCVAVVADFSAFGDGVAADHSVGAEADGEGVHVAIGEVSVDPDVVGASGQAEVGDGLIANGGEGLDEGASVIVDVGVGVASGAAADGTGEQHRVGEGDAVESAVAVDEGFGAVGVGDGVAGGEGADVDERGLFNAQVVVGGDEAGELDAGVDGGVGGGHEDRAASASGVADDEFAGAVTAGRLDLDGGGGCADFADVDHVASGHVEGEHEVVAAEGDAVGGSGEVVGGGGGVAGLGEGEGDEQGVIAGFARAIGGANSGA